MTRQRQRLKHDTRLSVGMSRNRKPQKTTVRARKIAAERPRAGCANQPADKVF